MSARQLRPSCYSPDCQSTGLNNGKWHGLILLSNICMTGVMQHKQECCEVMGEIAENFILIVDITSLL